MKTFCACGLFLLIAGSLAWAQEKAEEKPPVRVFMAKYSPDGSRLAIGFGATNVKGGLMVWNIERKAAEKVLPFLPGVSSLAMSPDGKSLAFTQVNRAPQVVRFPSLERDFDFDAKRRGPVDYSPDGKWFAMNAEDFGVYVRNLASEKDLPPLTGHTGRAVTMSFSPDSKRLAAPGTAGVFVWDVATSKTVHNLKHGEFHVTGVAFSQDSRWIFTGGFDGSMRLWNATTGEVRAKFPCRGGVHRLAYADSLHRVAAATYAGIELFHVDLSAPQPAVQDQIKKELARLDDDSLAVRQASSAALQKIGFAAEVDLAEAAKNAPSAEVRIGARSTRLAILAKPLTTLTGHTGEIRSLALSPDGKQLVSAGDDGTVRIWDLASGEQLELIVPADAKVAGAKE